MKNILIFLFALIPFSYQVKSQITHLPYPDTRKENVVDDYFGVKVSDPYRWLEDDNSEETKKWVDEENKITYDYLDKIPFKEKMKEQLTKVWNFEKMNTPFRRGKYYFFSKNNGLQNQSVLYYQEGLKGTPKILLDPNTLSEDGTLALSGFNIRKDGKYIAYNLSQSGSDWSTIVVMDLETQKNLSADTLHWIKSSGANWKGDGFYYSTYPSPTAHAYSGKNENNKVFFHKLGTKQSEDKIVYEDHKHPDIGWYIRVTEDEKYLILSGAKGTSGNSFAIKELNTEKWNWVDTTFNYEYNVVDHREGKLIVHTNHQASNWKVVLVDPKKPTPTNWQILIPEGKDYMESVGQGGNKLVIKYLHNVTDRLFTYNYKGKQLREITIPPLGVVGFSSKDTDNIAFYSFTNYTTPACIYKYNFKTNTSEVFFKPKVGFNSQDFESKQVFYASKDGTKIPMIITYKKGIQMNGNNPCFLYGYGGFNINITPSFIINAVPFLENGGIYAVANIRGGNEYGEAWHEAGIKCNKHNVFDDFIAAEEYLIKEGYTSSQKLAIHGRSNGGLLIGAVMTKRPDLAKIALPGVGVLDMLRYHKFTIGYYWASDYGRSDNEEEFKCLYKYSPLHNVKETNYPATLILTADHDDRVVPAHSFKFGATLQANNKSNEPILLRIDKKAGHGAGKPTSKQIKEWADIWSFVFYNLGMNLKSDL